MNRREVVEFQTRLLGVLEAIGKPVTTVELQAHPILAPLKMDGRAIGAHLRAMFDRKEIRKLPKKHWAALKSRTAVTVPESKEPPKMYFVLIPSEQKILLDVGGMRLPVVIE